MVEDNKKKTHQGVPGKVCRAYKADGHKGTNRRDLYELRYGKGIGVTELPIPRGDG